MTFDQVHSPWLPLLDTRASLALDVGAGSGRDALALEPACELRRLGEAAAAHQSIQWLDDSLPELNEIRKLKRPGVWWETAVYRLAEMSEHV